MKMKNEKHEKIPFEYYIHIVIFKMSCNFIIIRKLYLRKQQNKVQKFKCYQEVKPDKESNRLLIVIRFM